MSTPIASFNPANARTIRQMVYETLREAIFERELKTGDRLVEKELAEMLKVSRTPVREAMRQLEMEGLIEHLPRKGVVVRGLTPEDVMEIYAIREALEVATIPFIVQNITAEDMQKLHQLIAKMRRMMDEQDTGELLRISQQYNEMLIRASKMPRLMNLINTYQEYLAKFRTVTMSKPPRRFDALREHEEILQAIEQKDVRRAEELVRQHLRAAREEYLKNL
ncbi:hypothetical protein SY88_16335 [Clostridiales bacterium PH28_bin88]|nr:hypothetical protein SY88_16335 [Clostridiales bacterium PH28_bin88]